MCKYVKFLKYVFEFLLCFVITHLFLGSIWFNESFVKMTGDLKLFSLLTSLDDGGKLMDGYVLKSIIPSILVALALLLVSRKGNKKIIYGTLLVISCCFAIYQFEVVDYICKNVKSSDFIEKNYVNPDDVKIEFKDKKNLIYIILESMENTYTSEENGGYMKSNLIPNLTRLANDNINFSDINKLGGGLNLDGTSFTIASILGQMSGVPLKIDMDMIHRYDFDKFYEGITLGDILHKNGYENYIIMGSNSRFSNADILYKNHHYNVSDVNTAIEKGKMTRDDIVWWGYSDSDLFRYAKEDLTNISKRSKPFNYVINTMNTHFPDGYVEKDCEKIFGNQYYNVIYNSDVMVSDFINWVKEQDFYDNTVIIVVGDHITMDFKFCNSLPKDYKRTVYNVFINTGIKNNKVNNKNRLFTMLDMFPTTIAAIGGKIEGDRLGLGTNLFSGKKTIVEKYGYDNVQMELNKRSSFYGSLMGTR